MIDVWQKKKNKEFIIRVGLRGGQIFHRFKHSVFLRLWGQWKHHTKLWHNLENELQHHNTRKSAVANKPRDA